MNVSETRSPARSPLSWNPILALVSFSSWPARSWKVSSSQDATVNVPSAWAVMDPPLRAGPPATAMRAGLGLSGLVSSADVPSKRCPEHVLGRVGGRAGCDRMSVGPVDLAEAHAVERNPGVMRRKLQLSGRLAEINPARASVL